LTTRTSLVFVAGLAIIPLVRFFFDVRKGFDFLMYRCLEDDAFYYFEISKHIPEFNTGIPTSGFHPLYAFLIAPLHRSLHYRLAVPLSLLVLVLSYCAGTLLVFLIVSRYWNRKVGLVGAGAWAISGQLYAIAMTGLETIGAVVLVLAAVYAFSLFDTGTHTGRLSVWFGLLTGIAFLGRMDAPLFLAPFGACLLLKLMRQKRLRLAGLVVLLPAFCFFSWMGYIVHKTGEVFPNSAAALRVLGGIDDRMLVTAPEILGKNAVGLFRGLGGFILPEASFGFRAELGATLSALFLLGILLAVRGEERRHDPRSVFALLIACGTTVWGLYYVVFQGGFRYHYFAYLGIPAFCVAVPSVVSRLKSSVTFLLVTLVLWLSVWPRPPAREPQEYDKYRSALALNSLLPKLSLDGNLGSFNTGIYNYFCKKDIVNLDGVVNPEARRAMQANVLPQYVRAKGIRYMIEHDVGQATSFDRFAKDPRVKVSKLIDFRNLYRPYDKTYAKDTFLWRVEIVGARQSSEWAGPHR
jgi:hypothetical protein